jgi:citrate lyase subunit beta / citryl-CoA lyase
MLMRSKLFIPGNRPDLFTKALATAADALCFDLEDAVLTSQKAVARTSVGHFVEQTPMKDRIIMVRVNCFRSPEFLDDLASIAFPAVQLVALPKTDGPSEVRATAEALLSLERQRNIKRPIAILPTIESARGLRLAAEIAGSDARVIGLQLGLADLFQGLGIHAHDREATHQIRLQLRLAAGEAEKPCFDSAFAGIDDLDGFESDAQSARSLGFAGKSCIHPTQVASSNRIFSPTADEISLARSIVEAAGKAATAGDGVFRLDGRMIDEPFIRHAESVMRLAHEIATKAAD